MADDQSFRPLPHPDTADGTPRKVGVEIEFAGLTEAESAALAQQNLGGQTAPDGPRTLKVTESELGTLEIVLDTALRRFDGNVLIDAGLDAARGLVPVEIVTEPLNLSDLPTLDAFRASLREAGAIGTADGVLLGFGVHFNVAVVAPDDTHTLNTVRAFALCEDYLRAQAPLDITRRVMPFVDPWPRAFLRALVAAGDALTLTDLRQLYARHCNSRNHALDLLPLLQDADADAFADLFPKQTNTKGRPAFHYRMPDCRIDEGDWSLSLEWDRWVLIETLASHPATLDALSNAFAKRQAKLVNNRADWARQVAEILEVQQVDRVVR